jgi:predicted nucleotidyltransferase
MHTLIEQHIPEISALCRRYGVRRLDVFGSAARGADFDEAESDADFLVEFASGSHMGPLTQFVGLADDLQALLGRPVDLVEAGAVENPYILAGIESARETVYAR